MGKKGPQKNFTCSDSTIKILEGDVQNMLKINKNSTRATSTSQGSIQSEFGRTEVNGILGRNVKIDSYNV